MNSRVTVRLAAEADAAAACDVLRRSIVELCVADHGGDETRLAEWLANKTVKNVTKWISNPGNRVFVGCDGARVVGVAAMTTSGTVTLNYIAPEVRFWGVSSALIARIEKEAHALGLEQLQLQSTKTAEPFYRARGFSGECEKMFKWL